MRRGGRKKGALTYKGDREIAFFLSAVFDRTRHRKDAHKNLGSLIRWYVRRVGLGIVGGDNEESTVRRIRKRMKECRDWRSHYGKLPFVQSTTNQLRISFAGDKPVDPTGPDWFYKNAGLKPPRYFKKLRIIERARSKSTSRD
jgi:hypothetical protein